MASKEVLSSADSARQRSGKRKQVLRIMSRECTRLRELSMEFSMDVFGSVPDAIAPINQSVIES